MGKEALSEREIDVNDPGEASDRDDREERDERMAFFERAGQHTPYLATAAGGALFLVKTADKGIGRSLFGKQGRGELMVLGRAVAAIEGLLGAEAVAHQTFIDVGANIGTATIPAVLSYGFDSAVAIEPEPENVRVLRLNIVLNDLDDRIKTLPVAVSNEVGQSTLVINQERGGKHWIATDRSKLKRKNVPEGGILKVETVTLDHLVEQGVIDAERTGLLWMDAESHEGHILEGASSLLERGTPLVLEFNPSSLDRVGDRGKVERAVAENYTHFVAMHRNPEPGGPNFPLRAADELPEYAEGFFDPSHRSGKTDLLVLRLEPDQAAGIDALDPVIRGARSSAEDEHGDPDVAE